MSDPEADRQRQIADLEAALRLPLPEAARQQIEQSLQALISFGSNNRIGSVSVGDVVGRDKLVSGDISLSDDARINGVVVGVNLGTVIYGRQPQEDERRRLAWYLAGLANKWSRLQLRGIEDRLDYGTGINLPKIYTQLAITDSTVAARGSAAELTDYITPDGTRDLRTWVKPAYDPDLVLPGSAIRSIQTFTNPDNPHHETSYTLWRATLATEAVNQHPALVLLGDPGGGKSTFLRHLALALAQRGLDQLDAANGLYGWQDDRRLLPIILPLRALAGRIATEGAGEATIFAALRAEMQNYCMHQIDDLLSAALSQGTALLLYDGIDEVPLYGSSKISADRATTLAVLRSFSVMYPKARAVLTCRTRAFDDALRNSLGWPVETIAPFTLGQVRHFVLAWYGELVVKGQITADQAAHLSDTLITTIVGSPKLSEMAPTPLLLTMMALVRFNKGELPRDRPLLYERILELLLGEWDRVRAGESLAEVIGLPDWGSERLRPLLDQLSYSAHAEARSADGHGRLERGALYKAMIDFFKQAQVRAPGEAALRCLDYFEQRSGLLAPDGPDSYTFAHLTLQEHCAGRHIALNSENPVGLALYHRGDDRWREPIFLGAGLMAPAVLNSLLSDLIDRDEGGQDKPRARWYRDLILAAEIGKDRDWSYLRTRPMVKVERLQRDLRAGLVALLADRAQPLAVAERVQAGFVLGELGDPRFPVTLDEWRREVERTLAGDSEGYFCRVPAGSYIIGSREDDLDARNSEKPQHIVVFEQPFFIARYPITNAQWNTSLGFDTDESYYAHDPDLNLPNQPITGVDWYMASEFCTSLSEQLRVDLHLPTEQEWEAAARGADSRRYPWGDSWQEDRAASMEERPLRNWSWAVPVGCYPAGAAPCGALDMAGNIWEWTSSSWQSYPGAKKPFINNDRRVLRGGGYDDDSLVIRCGARFEGYLDNVLGHHGGFRVVLAPHI